MERMPTFAEYRSQITPLNSHLIDQYTSLVRAFNKLWEVVSERTQSEGWKADGFGECCGIDSTFTETEIFGPAREDILKLRMLRNIEAGGVFLAGICPYHRLGVGCILGDLKDPYCVDWAEQEHRKEIESKFGLYFLSMRRPLEQVLLGPDPGVNDPFVRKTIAGTKKIADYIQTFPVLDTKVLG